MRTSSRDEQRVALAGGQHPAGDRGGQLVGAEHVGREPGGRAGVEPVEDDHVGAPARASTSDGRMSRSSGRAAPTTSSGTSRAPLDEVLDEVEQQRLGPVDVVDHEHDRTGRGRAPASRRRTAQKVSSGEAGRAGAEQAAAPVDDAIALGLVVGDERGDGAPDRVGGTASPSRVTARSASAIGANVAQPGGSHRR